MLPSPPSIFALACIFLLTVATFAEGITVLPPGTDVDNSDRSAWNRVVLVATPRFASGDVDAVSESIRQSVSDFQLTIMARTSQAPQTSQYSLADVGVGYSMVIDGRSVVIDSESASQLGASLGFIQRRILSGNEAQIVKIVVKVRTTTLLIFDVPSIFLHRKDGQFEHRDFVNRHLVWIDPTSGEIFMATWLIDPTEKIPDVPLRIVAADTREDRRIHIDKSAFFLGIPNERAFALENLPPGKEIGWNELLRKLASRDSYNLESLRQLTDAINRVSRRDPTDG
ncbi:hypothetical protein [Planctomycetes bacterium CA13]|uniref:hypothetical protein n=1 Tax=Novipirellula herctigrandis TaxID=2527986 RepID=UPI0011B7D4AC